MNKKLKRILLAIIIISIIILIVDVVIFLNSKNKTTKIDYVSNNSYVKVDNSYYSVGSNNINSDNLERAELVKYNKDYEKEYSKIYKSKYNSTFFKIASDDKYLIAVGSIENSKEENEEGLRTGLLIKYDLDGNIIFKKKYQNLGDTKFTNVLVLDDSYIVIGQSIFPNYTLGYNDEGGAIMIKYSKDGEIIWKKNYGGNKSGLFNDIILVDNYLYLVGKDASRYGLVAKYDLDGELVKAVSYSKTDTLGFSSVVYYDDNLYAVGAKKINEDDEYDHDTDALIVKYDMDLNKVKEKKFNIGKDAIDRFNKIILVDNKLITIGHAGIVDKEKSTDEEYVYYYNSFVNIYNSDLKLSTKKIYNKYMDNYFTDISLEDNNLLISGYYKYRENKYKTDFITYSKELD